MRVLIEDLVRNAKHHTERFVRIEQSISDIQDKSKKGPESPPSAKPIMDHKAWDEVSKLTNDRSGFRDWRAKFKVALKQVSKIGMNKVMVMMYHLERNNTFTGKFLD